MKRRLGKIGTTVVAAALFVSMSSITAAQAGGYHYGYSYGYSHGGYGHGYRHGYGYSKYHGHYRHGYGHRHRSGAAIIVPTIAIGVAALLYLDHKKRKHRHTHDHHHHHHGCHGHYSDGGCGYAPAAPAPSSQPAPSGDSINDRLAGGPVAQDGYPNRVHVAPQKASSDTPLIASNAPCRPVTSRERQPNGHVVHYQAMLCYHTNGTAFIQPGSKVPISTGY